MFKQFLLSLAISAGLAEKPIEKPTLWQSVSQTISAHPYLSAAAGFVSVVILYKIFKQDDPRRITIKGVTDSSRIALNHFPSETTALSLSRKLLSGRYGAHVTNNFYKSGCQLAIVGQTKLDLEDPKINCSAITIDNRTGGNTLIVQRPGNVFSMKIIQYGKMVDINYFYDQMTNQFKRTDAALLTLNPVQDGVVDIIIECPQEIYNKIKFVGQNQIVQALEAPFFAQHAEQPQCVTQ